MSVSPFQKAVWGLNRNSHILTIQGLTLRSRPKGGNGKMEKSIHSDEYSAVTDVIRELRRESGLTQVQMAEMLGQTQSLFSKYERGEVRLDVIQLRTIAGKLGLTLTEISERIERRLTTATQSSRRKSSSTRR